MSYDPALLLSVTAALKSLPGVRPGLGYALLKDIRDDLAYQTAEKPFGKGRPHSRALVHVLEGEIVYPRFGGVVVTKDDINSAFQDDDWGSGDGLGKLTPAGADLLLRMYYGAAFAVDEKKAAGGSIETLRGYGAQVVDAHVEAAATREAHKRLVEFPETIPESQFSYGLLNEVFIHRFGLGGDRDMEIGGIRVYKSLLPYESNSGKSRDFRVEFSWAGADGEAHTIVKPSRYAGNRRNDEARNWGLGRE